MATPSKTTGKKITHYSEETRLKCFNAANEGGELGDTRDNVTLLKLAKALDKASDAARAKPDDAALKKARAAAEEAYQKALAPLVESSKAAIESITDDDKQKEIMQAAREAGWGAKQDSFYNFCSTIVGIKSAAKKKVTASSRYASRMLLMIKQDAANLKIEVPDDADQDIAAGKLERIEAILKESWTKETDIETEETE